MVLVLGYLAFAQQELAPYAVTSILAAALAYAAVILGLQMLTPVPGRSHWPMTGRCWAMLALITWVLWHAGESRGPLVNLYQLVIVTSALTLSTATTLINLGLIVLAVVLLGHPQAPGAAITPERTLTLFLQLAPMLLVAYVTARLAGDIRRALDRIRFISETDELTRLYNLRAFMGIAERLHRQAKRYGRPYALVMIDSDNLKAVNDAHGHDSGNELLRLTTLGIRRQLRDTDVAARYGGDEFILLLPETTAAGARELGERIRQVVAAKPLDKHGMRITTSVSIGIASFPEHGTDLRSILNKADQAMYLSKKTGRNRVTLFDPG